MRTPAPAIRLLVLAAAAAMPACAARAAPVAPVDPALDTTRRAALARLTVANRSPHPVAVAFRTVTAAAREVEVGRVAANAVAEMAPIPAGEPIVLMARTEDGALYSLAARTFEADDDWSWIIPRDATFTPAGTGTP